ncbi:MAG: M23 family metallopeptidase [Chloroflexi bacterium]|nr:M23 family metallopeptidase [Chloroflexota bacterium]
MMRRRRARRRALWLAVAVLLWFHSAVALAQTTAQKAEAALLPTATAIEEIEIVEHNVLHRPIELTAGHTHWIDRTYTYGGTQQNLLPVHLGVEFVNARDTPVYAAKAGRVIFAGDDSKALIGPQLQYYGNVVILAHDLRSLAGSQVFTLYGHLNEIHVRAGQLVEDLERLGTIGSSGVAIGPHLHFEVRVGDALDYKQTRNPELWLQHYVDHGMIAGALRNEEGEAIHGWRITVRSDSAKREVSTYGGGEVNSDPVWRENFTVSDLLAGEYEILVLDESGRPTFFEIARVEPYRTTYVEIVLSE